MWPEGGHTSPIFLPIGVCWAPFGQGVHDGVHQAPVVQEGRLKGVSEAEGVFGTKFFARVTDEINGLNNKDKSHYFIIYYFIIYYLIIYYLLFYYLLFYDLLFYYLLVYYLLL